MAIIKYKPTSPGRRFQSVSDFAEITSAEPVKSLLKPIKERAAAKTTGALHRALSAAATSASTG